MVAEIVQPIDLFIITFEDDIMYGPVNLSLTARVGSSEAGHELRKEIISSRHLIVEHLNKNVAMRAHTDPVRQGWELLITGCIGSFIGEKNLPPPGSEPPVWFNWMRSQPTGA